MARKNYDLPNQQLLNDAYGTFCSITESILEFNRAYFEQTKALFEANLQNTKKLYQVSTPDELSSVLTHILSQNSALLTKAFLEELNLALIICNKVCTSSASCLDSARVDGFQVYDFCSKLLPNTLSLKVDEAIKSAANGNHAAAHNLQQFIEKMLDTCSGSVKETAKTVLDNLDRLDKVRK